MSIEVIKAQYNHLSPMEDAEWHKLKGISTFRKLKKNDYFFVPGNDPSDFAVILKGVFRHFYVDNDGKEWVKSFASTYGLIGPHAEFLQKIPVRTYIQAITDAEILVVPYSEFYRLTENQLGWEVLLKRITEFFYLDKENREFLLLTTDAVTRYKLFLESHKHILNIIPDHQIASYIGITPQALSRIRKKLSIS
jgi:CRP-like cAMP-binding protein